MTALSKYTKECIIRRIMADIPVDNIAQRAADAFLAAAVAALPPKVRAAYDDPETRNFINHARFGTNCGAIYGKAPAPIDTYSTSGWVAFAGQEAWDALMKACADNRAQAQSRDKIKAELEANFASIRTVKQFQERFPELVKYLPPSQQPVANLPATTALIDTLRAAGLPAEAA